MHLTHLIIDDFLDDPEAVRAEALSLDYPRLDKSTYFPGRNAARPIGIPGVEQRICALLQERLGVPSNTSHGKPRLALEGDEGAAGVHIDNAHWSRILYLTRDEDCKGGTEFFRHIRTGTEHAPVFPGDAEAMGYQSPTVVWDDILTPETKDRSKWEQTFVIPMKFNRLALFRSYLWHDAGPTFGDSVENGRLILPWFFAPM